MGRNCRRRGKERKGLGRNLRDWGRKGIKEGERGGGKERLC